MKRKREEEARRNRMERKRAEEEKGNGMEGEREGKWITAKEKENQGM